MGRPEAGDWGHGKAPSCSGGALGCLGAACASRRSREADGVVSSNRVEAVLNQLSFGSHAGIDEPYGTDIPSASMALAMVLAVYLGR